MVIYYNIWKCASRCFMCRNCNFFNLTNKNRFWLWMFVLTEDVATQCISFKTWISRQPPHICVSSRTLISNEWRLVLCTFVRDIWMCEQKTPTPGKHGNITRWIFNGHYSDYKYYVSVLTTSDGRVVEHVYFPQVPDSNPVPETACYDSFLFSSPSSVRSWPFPSITS